MAAGVYSVEMVIQNMLLLLPGLKEQVWVGRP